MTVRLVLVLTLALLSISSTALVVRYVSDVPALTLAFWRMLIASGLLWVYGIFKPESTLSIQQKKLIGFAGIFLGCHFACFFLAVRHTTIANATLLGCMLPVFTVLVALIQKQPISKATIAGLALALGGAFIIQTGEITLGGQNSFGNLIAVLGAFFIAVTFVIAGRVRQNTDTTTYGKNLFLIAAVTLLIISNFTGNSVLNISIRHLHWLLFLGIVPSILGHNLLNYSLKYISPTAVSAIPLGEPIIASLLGLLWFGEAIAHQSILGGPIILVGVFIILKSQSLNGSNS